MTRTLTTLLLLTFIAFSTFAQSEIQPPHRFQWGVRATSGVVLLPPEELPGSWHNGGASVELGVPMYIRGKKHTNVAFETGIHGAMMQPLRMGKSTFSFSDMNGEQTVTLRYFFRETYLRVPLMFNMRKPVSAWNFEWSAGAEVGMFVMAWYNYRGEHPQYSKEPFSDRMVWQINPTTAVRISIGFSRPLSDKWDLRVSSFFRGQVFALQTVEFRNGRERQPYNYHPVSLGAGLEFRRR